MDIAALGLEIRSDGVVVASDRLDRFGRDAERAERSTHSLTNAFRVLAPVVGTVMAAFSVNALRRYADGWSDMQSRVGAAIRNMDAAPEMMGRIVDIANASYSPLEQTAEIYARNVGTLRELGIGAAGAADFTEALNHALVITATRGQRAESVQNALSKAMAVGRLQADGLETVLTNGGRVAEVLAEELGTTVNGLRQLATDGKITGDVIASALIGRLDVLREQAAEMPATMEDASVRIGTNVTALVGSIDQATGASGNFATSLIGLADSINANTDNFVRAAVTIQTVFGQAIETAISMVGGLGIQFDGTSMLIIAGAGAASLVVTALGGVILNTISAITVALMANPFALLIAGIGAAVAAAFIFRDEIKQAVGVDVVEVMTISANSVVGAFKGAYDAIGILWGNFPQVMEAVGSMAANAFIGAIEWMINEAGKKLNEFLSFASRALGMFGPAILADNMGGPQFGNVSITRRNVNPQGIQSIDAMGRAFSDAQGINYVGEMADALGEAWDNAAGANQTLDELQNTLTAANDNAGSLGNTLAGETSPAIRQLGQDFTQVGQQADQFTRSLASGLAGVFNSIIEGSKSAGQAVGDLLKQLGNLLINGAFQSLFGSGGGGFNPLGWLFGGARANGGPLQAGTSYLVGERGPEIFTAGATGFITPNHAIAANGNFGSANDNRRGDINITINGSGLNEQQLARAIGHALASYDESLAGKVEGKFRTMQNDPRAADGRW